MTTFSARAAQAARRLRLDGGGNVAMMLAIGMVPLCLASLGAVDLARGVAAKVELQDALDAAALAAGRTAGADPSALQQTGERILAQNLNGVGDLTLTGSSFTFGQNGAIEASASGSFSPATAGLVGGGPMTLNVSTEVVRANNILEIAMVLDNTGSMNDSLGRGQGSKISQLRTAAASFVDVLSAASAQSTTANAVQISLVPFSNTVKVGSSYSTATWIDGSGVSPINDQIFTTSQGHTQHASRFDLFANLHTSWAGCVESRQAPYDIQDTAPTPGSPATLFTPSFAPDEEDGNNNANDYVKDPKKDASGNNLDWWGKQGSITKYSNSPKTSLNTSTGPNAGCTMQSIQRLTTNFSGLKSAIGSMVAGGDTNIPMGLVWGWHTLSPSGPFGDGVAYLTPKHKKIVVLMTDGQNTMTPNNNATNNNSTYSGLGYVWQGRLIQANGSPLTSISSSGGTRTDAMDDRLRKLCANMKASDVGIEIYAIGVGVTSDSKALLTSCASGDDHYFDVQNGADMTPTFQSIANQIAALHLSK